MKLLGFLMMLAFVSYGQPKGSAPSSWKEVKLDKRGDIIAYWFDSSPFIDIKDGQLYGIEYELMHSFIKFVETSYGVTLNIEWIRGSAFDNVFQTVKNSSGGTFGLSAFSITKERSQEVSFTPPYLPDIAVIISNRKVPEINDEQEFREVFDNARAVTIYNSTFEAMLNEIKDEHNFNFSIDSIPSSGGIINIVAKDENVFGYTDLPSYLAALEKNIPIRRQRLYSFQLEGLSFIYPLQSDWTEPLTTYFSSLQFKLKRAQLIAKYFGEDVFALTEKISKNTTFSSSEEVLLLTKEKQLQSEELLETQIKIQREKMIRNLLILGVFMILLTTIFLYNRYSIKSKNNEALSAKQREIEKQNNKLTLMDKEKNNLIHVLAHDLRSPIGQISGLAQIVKADKDKLNQEQLDLLDQIITTSSRVNSMVSKILNIEAIESNEVNVSIESIDCSELLNTVINSFRERAMAKNISLFNGYDDDLPAIKADPIYLTQVLENLVSNAIKFSEPDKNVYLNSTENSTDLIIEVKDEGPGISKEDQKKLFKKFQKLSAQPTAGEPSTGLGLSIVKKYVIAMKGEVWCESKIGEGASFKIKIPLA